MSPDDFVQAVYQDVYLATVEGVVGFLESPPGRRPRADLVELADWYRAMPAPQRSMIERLVRLSADHAIFGMLAVVDGVRLIDEQHSDVTLHVGESEVSKDKDLHDIFRATVDADEYLI